MVGLGELHNYTTAIREMGERTASEGDILYAARFLFLVYNDTEGLNGLGPVNRAFIVKVSRQFDVLR